VTSFTAATRLAIQQIQQELCNARCGSPVEGVLRPSRILEALGVLV
jgi:hypothetical protein